MNWSFVIQQKLKAAILLGGIMSLIILGSVLSRHNVQGIDRSVSSIYKDRLVPATAIIYLTENLYGKRLALEKHLFLPASETAGETRNRLQSYDRSIDSLIGIFEKTYLVDQESKRLADFKKHVDRYRLMESRIISLSQNGSTDEGKGMFRAGDKIFQNAIDNLNALTSIQSTIGASLMKESKSEMASFGILSLLQIGLAIIIGLMVLVIIQSDRIINKEAGKNKRQYFNLN